MSIPKSFLDELRERISVSDVIGRRIHIIRKGREFSACCPFHNEKTPSFTINDQKQFYHCFGCGAHGDIIKFMMEYENISFRDAVERLATETGMEIPKQTKGQYLAEQQAGRTLLLMDQAASWFEKQLFKPAHSAALDYLKGRGLEQELIKTFRIGFAPDHYQSCRQDLLSLGYTDQEMIEAGLIRHSDKGKEPYSFFRGRIMFPVINHKGNVVAFGGRVLPDHLQQKHASEYTPPKYLNSPDTNLFNKGRMLYGAGQGTQKDHTPIVTEGYLDVIACYKAGFKATVAPLGTALTDQQIELLWKMIPDENKAPVLCFDGDAAGRRAALNACERILPKLKAGHTFKFAFMPEGEDPDSLIRSQGKQVFRRHLENAVTLLDFIWMHHTHGRDFKTPESRAGLEAGLKQEASKITDKSVQYYYNRAFREKVRDFFWQSNKAPTSSHGPKILSKPLAKPKVPSSKIYERALLATIINHPAIFENIEEDLGTLSLVDPHLEKMRQYIIQTLIENPDMARNTLIQSLKENGLRDALQTVLTDEIYTHANFSRTNKLPLPEILNEWKKLMCLVHEREEQAVS